jgi:hypothetical protein
MGNGRLFFVRILILSLLPSIKPELILKSRQFKIHSEFFSILSAKVIDQGIPLDRPMRPVHRATGDRLQKRYELLGLLGDDGRGFFFGF